MRVGFKSLSVRQDMYAAPELQFEYAQPAPGRAGFRVARAAAGYGRGQFWLDSHGGLHDFRPNLKKIAAESLRGATVLGGSLGTTVAFYARAVRLAAVGRLSGWHVPGAAVVPALGVGGTALADAVAAQALGAPTDPEGRSNPVLHWVSPVLNGLASVGYRFAPLIKKPRPGTPGDLLAQMLVSAGGGAASYSTREWLAQRSTARARPPRRAPGEVSPEVPDRFLGRTATQAVSTALRWQLLLKPTRAPDFFFPVVVATSVPFGWREAVSRKIAGLRRSGGTTPTDLAG